MFTHNFKDVKESGDFTPIPDGIYLFWIGKKEVRKSRNGDNQVALELNVYEGEFEGRKVFHTVTFLPQDNKGAGIAKRWLHAIGEAYEGDVEIEPENWTGHVSCEIGKDKYINKKGQEKEKNVVLSVLLPEESDTPKPVAKTEKTEEKNDDVPF